MQELIFPVLTVLLLVGLMFMVSQFKSKSTFSNSAVRDVERVLLATDIFCSPDMPEVRARMNKTLTYLEPPWPVLSFYPSAAVAEEAYMNITTSADASSSRIIGVDFGEMTDTLTVNYSLRFKAHDVAGTEVLFNHERKLLSFFCAIDH